MRLLNTTTYKLHECFGHQVPPYVILSHTWGNEEVTFQDLRDERGSEMEGWSKIVGCCKQALVDGFEYTWIDSCCIDKSSSAELSEAINSMYHWYQDAQVCYVYLKDVPHRSDLHKYNYQKVDFSLSRWFTRGWTLQELLAPQMVIFFDHVWGEIGTKASLSEDIKQITGISDLYNFQSASVAQKMSWAAARETTRVEDRAYSLMGLFNISMPTLYGEGERAFLRLQLEIIRTTEDQSIFAWASGTSQVQSGLLATSPSSFIGSENVLIRHSPKPQRPSPYSMTSRGLNIDLDMYTCWLDGKLRYVAMLDCHYQKAQDTFLAVYLTEISGTEGIFTRVLCDKLLSVASRRRSRRRTNIYVKQEYFADRRMHLDASLDFVRIFVLHSVSSPMPESINFSSEGRRELKSWKPAYCRNMSPNGKMEMQLCREFEVSFVLLIAVLNNGSPLLDIKVAKEGESLHDLAAEIKREDESKMRARFTSDAVGRQLNNSGETLTAVLKKKLVSGLPNYVIELSITVDKQDEGGLPLMRKFSLEPRSLSNALASMEMKQP